LTIAALGVVSLWRERPLTGAVANSHYRPIGDFLNLQCAAVNPSFISLHFAANETPSGRSKPGRSRSTRRFRLHVRTANPLLTRGRGRRTDICPGHGWLRRTHGENRERRRAAERNSASRMSNGRLPKRAPASPRRSACPTSILTRRTSSSAGRCCAGALAMKDSLRR
jgi:hypothetical protein